MSFEEWKSELANALERRFNWGAGAGLFYVEEGPGEIWRNAFDEGLTPDEMAFHEHARFLVDEGNDYASAW